MGNRAPMLKWAQQSDKNKLLATLTQLYNNKILIIAL